MTAAGLKAVYSHPQALAQCEQYLKAMTGVEIIAVYDTAGGAKLVAEQKIFGAAALALVVLIVVTTIISDRMTQHLSELQQRYVPQVELGPTLEGQFEDITRALQDAVAADDTEALAETRSLKDAFLSRLSIAAGVLDPAKISALHGAMEEYFAAKRRLFTGAAPPPAAVNVGDDWGRRLADELAECAGPDRMLFDVVYDPWPTPLAAAWEKRGGRVAGGLDLLVHQAVGQLRLMTGRDVPPRVLRAAIR